MRKHSSFTRHWAAVGFMAGILGALAITVLFLIARGIGIESPNLEMTLGALVLDSVSAGVWFFGLILHLLIGGFVGAVLGGVFHGTGHAGWKLGAVYGLVVWAVSGALLGVVGNLPGDIEPGFYGAHFGGTGFSELLFAHLIYGSIVGEVYEGALARRRVDPSPESAYRPDSPLADALGQNKERFESYKRRRTG